jgi:TolB-like protein/DNA-binding winged helix-turn-helix (wHTH) protein/Flp pilus assembly protein TadD
MKDIIHIDGQARHLRFGVFEVDLHTGELCKQGRKVKLPGQPFQVLAMLLERPGDLVTRGEIRERVWPEDTFVDFEHSINTAVKLLRQALGDETERPHYIETLPRRGYRFIAPVEPVAPVREPPLRRRWAIALAAGVVAISLAVIVALNVAGTRDRVLRAVGAVREPPLRVQSLAVLPLENLSHDPEQEYFADGMTEALITDLGKIRALRVISRTSVMQYKGTRKPLPEIARELNVDAVLEGTVARSGNRVRITANLLHAPTDRHLWAETYESNLGDVLVLQDEVAQAIASEIKVKLTPQEQARFARAQPVNPEAHEAYLRGRYYWNLRTEQNLKRGIEYFQQAIEKDPGYALAYTGLADSYVVLGTGALAPRETFPRAKAAAFKALEIDETLAEPHASLGWVKADFDWDWAGAEKEFKRAIELNPGYATAHHWYALYLSAMGRHNEAITEIKRAWELDPLSLIINTAAGQCFFWARRYDEAIAQFQRTFELNPGFSTAHYYLAWAYQQKRLYDEAISEYQKCVALAGGNPADAVLLARGYAAAGNRTQALKIISDLREHSKQRPVASGIVAETYTALGDFDQAFAWAERTYKEHSPDLIWLKVDPMADPLRSDPRFRDLLRRMNFPP